MIMVTNAYTVRTIKTPPKEGQKGHTIYKPRTNQKVFTDGACKVLWWKSKVRIYSLKFPHLKHIKETQPRWIIIFLAILLPKDQGEPEGFQKKGVIFVYIC